MMSDSSVIDRKSQVAADFSILNDNYHTGENGRRLGVLKISTKELPNCDLMLDSSVIAQKKVASSSRLFITATYSDNDALKDDQVIHRFVAML